MIRTRGIAGVGPIAAAVALWVGQAAAGVPAGMIMEVTGSSEPKMDALTEVEPGFRIRLAVGSRLIFMHYMSCRSVSVEGGTVLLRMTDFSISDGGRVQSEQRRCPQRFVLTTGEANEVASTVLLRGGSAAVARIPTRPILLLTGPAAPDVAAAEIRLDGKLVARLPLSGRRAALPESAAALMPGRKYAVVLLPAGGGQPLSQELFTATETGADPAERAVVLSLQ